VIRVGVIGAHGAMGSLACTAIGAAPDLDLGATIGNGDSLDALRGVDVVVELTHPGVVLDHVAWCIEHGRPIVVGTSGFTEERLTQVRAMLGRTPATGVLVIPNFSVGAALMMRFAAEAAAYTDSVEIVEMHHPAKRDAPSGTALRTAQLVAEARRNADRPSAPDATETDDGGARGGTVEGVRVHSLRVAGAVAHQEVVLGSPGETLTIRHDMLDRAATMPGLLVCVRVAPSVNGLVVGLDEVLSLSRPPGAATRS
jgi:4-hydroxy-tetrahydrodipicolinate reductase